MRNKPIHHLAVGSLATNCWIYPLEDSRQPASCAVIDPGDEGGRIIALLDRLGLIPAYIILTHGHFDHTGAVQALIERYGGRQADAPSGETPETGIPVVAIHADEIQYSKLKFRIGRYLAEGDSIGPFTVLHLPGHSAGSIGLWDPQAEVLFSGDTLFNGDYGRTDLPGGNGAQMSASLKRLFAMDGGIQVYPGHGEITTIDHEARSNDFL